MVGIIFAVSSHYGRNGKNEDKDMVLFFAAMKCPIVTAIPTRKFDTDSSVLCAGTVIS